MNFKSVIGTIAPFLGALIGGPMGGVAGKLIGTALLGNENATQEEIEKAIGVATPEQLVKLKQIDAETRIKYAEIGLDEKKIAAMDRDSARQREISTGDKMPAILSIVVTGGFFGILTAILFYGKAIPSETFQTLNIMLGVLGAGWSSLMAYYFGSSAGSAKKDTILKNLR